MRSSTVLCVCTNVLRVCIFSCTFGKCSGRGVGLGEELNEEEVLSLSTTSQSMCGRGDDV